MVRFLVRELAEERGWTISKLAEVSGIAYSSALDLWYDRPQRIDKKTIERLCIALNVQPGALFKYVPEKKEQASEQ